MMRTLVNGMIVLLVMAVAVTVHAQQPGSTDAPPKVDITIEQQALLKDYEGFEKRLAELAESLRSSDLDRSNLLLMARSESQKQQVQQRLTDIAAILSDKRPYADAVERQKLVVKHMEEILKILQTDANWDKLQARIRQLEERAKETGRLIALQKDVRADTERGSEFRPLSEAERKVLEAAGNLADKIDAEEARREAEEGRPSESGQPEKSGDPAKPEGDQPQGESPADKPTPGDSKPQDPQPGDQKPGDDKPGEQKPGEQKSGEQKPGEQEPGEQKPGQQPPMGQPSQGQPNQSPPLPGQQSPPQPGQPQDQQSPGEQDQGEQPESAPGRQDLEEARREMQQAIEELKQQNRDRASNEQDAAIAKLEQMKAKIEEILRQLRQEEKEMYLTQLEARFQEMLKLQLRINADTVRLDARDSAERGEAHFTKSRDLSRQQQQNVLAADKAHALLVEEGSSVAFPEAVEQLKSNMETVTLRLSKGDTGETSQLIEKLIVESLEEMVLSLQKELEKLKQDQQQQQQQQQQQPQDRSLVDTLAELKMIRSLQNQVNRLTKQVGLEIDGERAQDSDTLKLLRDLSRRQERIQEATYDLSTGKNR